MIGSSAAALIGLMFVVVTLTAGRDRGELERGKRLYTTPIIWHLAAVLLLSGLVLAPSVTRNVVGIGSVAIAVAGVHICRSGRARHPPREGACKFHWL